MSSHIAIGFRGINYGRCADDSEFRQTGDIGLRCGIRIWSKNVFRHRPLWNYRNCKVVSPVGSAAVNVGQARC